MATAGAELVAIEIPGLEELVNDPLGGFVVLRADFKFDLDAFLAERPDAPVGSLEEILATGKVSTAEQVLPRLQGSQAVESRDTDEYRAEIAKRALQRDTIVAMMDAENLDAIAFPTNGYVPTPLGEAQPDDSTCRVAARSGLPAMSVPAGFTEAGLPVGLELLSRPWSESRLLGLAYSYERRVPKRRPPATTPPLPRGSEAD